MEMSKRQKMEGQPRPACMLACAEFVLQASAR